MLGKLIQQYKILDKLGAGGMDEVFLAEDTTLERRGSLKLLALDNSKESELVEWFPHNAQTAE